MIWRRPRGGSTGGLPAESISTVRRVLVVVRTVTSLNRLVDALPAIGSDRRLSVKFVIDKGSRFEGELSRHLEGLGMEVVDWKVAKATRWDLVIAAHTNTRLGELRGPLVTFSHGAGYSRILQAVTGDPAAPVGIAGGQIKRGRRIVPTAIGLSHEEQREQVIAACPEALDRTFPMGDPTFDRIVANRHFRNQFRTELRAGNRRLVVVTSTWGPHSCVAEQQELALLLVAQLPVDEWQVALILHPNVWFGHSRWEVINSMFADALGAGLLLIPPMQGWQATLIAADVVVGDHGSVAFYGAALGHPFRLAATGLAELAPGSARIDLSKVAEPLDVDGDLLAQLESHVARHDPAQLKAITDRTLGWQGQSLILLRNKLYEQLRLDLPKQPPQVRPLEGPVPIRGPCLTAHLVGATIRADDAELGIVELRRFPASAGQHRADEQPVALPLIIDDTELNTVVRQNAEIVVHSHPMSEHQAEHWLRDLQWEFCGAALFAADTGSRCLLRWRGGRCIEAFVGPAPGYDQTEPDALVAAAAVYHWMLDGRWEVSAESTLLVRMGVTKVVITVRPIVYVADRG